MNNNNEKNGEKKQYSSLVINGAMRYIFDTLEKLMLISSYCLLGEAARGVKEDRQIDTDLIEVGIFKKQLTPEVKSFFKEWGFTEVNGNEWHTAYEGLPIVFKEIEEKPYFVNPDTRFYDVDEYRIPNPFDEYLRNK